MPDPKDPNPQAVTAATPVETKVSTEPAASINGTVKEPSGEAPEELGQAAPALDGDTFTGVDPNSLPPKERVAYDNMLRDYKKKTAEIAEVRRKAEAFDVWQREQAARQRITDDDYQRAFESKDGMQQFLQKAAEPVVNELKETKAELAATKADLFVKDFKVKHPDFDELDSDGLITGYVRLNPPQGEGEWEPVVKSAYNYAKKLRSKWEETGYKRGITRIEEKAAQSTELPSGSPAQVYSGGDPTKLTAREAVELAMQGIKVPR